MSENTQKKERKFNTSSEFSQEFLDCCHRLVENPLKYLDSCPKEMQQAFIKYIQETPDKETLLD